MHGQQNIKLLAYLLAYLLIHGTQSLRS